MSLINMKTGNKTVALFSLFIIFLYGFLTASAFGIIPSGWVITTALGTLLFTIVGSTALLLETYFEGKKPNLKKDTGALINTIFAIFMLVYGAVVFLMQIEITGTLRGVSGVGYAVILILLAKELIFD